MKRSIILLQAIVWTEDNATINCDCEFIDHVEMFIHKTKHRGQCNPVCMGGMCGIHHGNQQSYAYYRSASYPGQFETCEDVYLFKDNLPLPEEIVFLKKPNQPGVDVQCNYEETCQLPIITALMGDSTFVVDSVIQENFTSHFLRSHDLNDPNATIPRTLQLDTSFSNTVIVRGFATAWTIETVRIDGVEVKSETNIWTHKSDGKFNHFIPLPQTFMATEISISLSWNLTLVSPYFEIRGCWMPSSEIPEAAIENLTEKLWTYFVIDKISGATYQKLEDACSEMNGTLASPMHDAQNEAILSLASQHKNAANLPNGTSYLIGLKKENGSWKYSNGHSLGHFQDWSNGYSLN